MLQAGDVLHMVIFSGQKKIIMYLLKSALHLSGGGGGLASWLSKNLNYLFLNLGISYIIISLSAH